MIRSPLMAIRAHCVDCSGESRAEVRRCQVIDCPLFPFRMGRNPNRQRPGGRKVADPVACGESLVGTGVPAPETAFAATSGLPPTAAGDEQTKRSPFTFSLHTTNDTGAAAATAAPVMEV
jgi:hypothetical protein